MKKLICTVSLIMILVATKSHAANVYIFDASGTMQKLERFFLSATRCTIDGVSLPPINTGEFVKYHLDGRKLSLVVLCKIDRALDVKKDITAGKSDVYLKITTSRYKRSKMERVFNLPDNFYSDFTESK